MERGGAGIGWSRGRGEVEVAFLRGYSSPESVMESRTGLFGEVWVTEEPHLWEIFCTRFRLV